MNSIGLKGLFPKNLAGGEVNPREVRGHPKSKI